MSMPDDDPTDRTAEPVRKKGDTVVVDDTTLPSHRGAELEGLSAFIVGEHREDTDPPARGPVSLYGDDDLGGVVLAGRYHLDFELGRGGMGAVWVAEHLTLRVPVAVKVMLERVAKHQDYVRRFRREARAMSTLRHRHIVQVMDYGVEQGRPFIVMEYLRGQNLATWQDALGRLPTSAEIAQIVLPLCDAFDAAHGAGIIHRDLKPENIFLAEEGDGRSVLKVLDFGLARMDDDTDDATLTRENLVSGTPLYMSPEQCRSLAQVGPATDLYALGCVLTELLQGSPPFGGKSHADVLTQQMFSAPPPLQRTDGSWPVPPLLEKLRLDLLAKRPELRPPNVAAVRERFLEALDPVREAARLPPRKGPAPVGARDARVPEWTAPDAHTTTPPVGRLSGQVLLLHLEQSPEGLDDAAVIGLSTSGLGLRRVEPDDRPPFASLMVIDAGDQVTGACAWLDAHLDVVDAGAIVCVREASGPILKRLIAAGAAEILPYPVEVGALMKMVRRLLRRRHRRTSR